MGISGFAAPGSRVQTKGGEMRRNMNILNYKKIHFLPSKLLKRLKGNKINN